jgi:hypothetical protein
VRSWSFEITRSELDVTTIGVEPGQFAPFRQYIVGFADGSGSCSVYVTNEDSALSNRMMEDVLQRQQVGCGFKLYTDKQATEVLEPLDQHGCRAAERRPQREPRRPADGGHHLPPCR